MNGNFGTIMAAIYQIEGGFSNDPRDPGGMTDMGITARSWAAWLRVPLSTITAAQMRALTPAEADPFYRAEAWNLVDGDVLPSGVDAMAMHFEVNAGGVAARELQGIVGVVADGVIGPRTLAAIGTYTGLVGVPRLVQAMADAQVAYYKGLPGFARFGDGWLRRVQAMQALAERLMGVGAFS